MQALIDNKSVKAIFFARGGYGSSQLLNKLNYSKLEKHPKWFVGYSDITAFHIALNNLGFETIQGPMMKGFNKDSRPERRQPAAIPGSKGFYKGHRQKGNHTV
ncbi:hypothetical protein MMG03_002283 [Fibrobacter succinogenes]|nr:hypothetical protein [Fibrobacter succinogenes]